MTDDPDYPKERWYHRFNEAFVRWARSSLLVDRLLFLLLVGLLTLIYSPVALLPPYLPAVGDIAARSIKADRDILIEDPETTQKRREQAGQLVLPIYDWDPVMMEPILTQIRDAIVWLDQTRSEFKRPVESKGEGGGAEKSFHDKAAPTAHDGRENNGEAAAQHKELREGFTQRFESEVSERAFDALLAMDDLPALLVKVQNWLGAYSQQKVVSGPEVMKDLARNSYLIHSLQDGSETRIYGAADVIDLDGLRRLLTNSATEKLTDVPWSVRRLFLEVARADVRPNLVMNLAETKSRRQKAYDSVDQIYIRARQGEIVVREGELVTELIHRKIEVLTRSHWTGVALMRILGLAASIALCFLLGRRFLVQTATSFPRDKKTLYLLGTIILVIAFLSSLIYTVGQGLVGLLNWPTGTVQFLPPVSLGAALVSLIIGARVALPGGAMLVGTVLSFLSSLMAEGGLSLFIYYLIGSLVGGFTLRSCRHRSDVLKSGMWIGLIQVVAVPLVESLDGNLPSWDWIFAMGMALSSGLLAGLLGLALIPLLEMLFNVTTDSRLLELASGDHPLLKQLSLRAPGTYHHSNMVGNLAEAAAESIGANPLLARVMALYHDVGKMAKPQYFIENQSGANRHDQLVPSMSVKVIVSHIKQGVEMARQYKLGAPILEAITEHQGTTLLQYFYNKALNDAIKRGETVAEEDFRYPGPKPRTREAGILMLADSVEAAARSLKNPAPAQIQATVKRIVAGKIEDGQLDECKLTLREMAKIEEAFYRVLTLGFYHRRIEYPGQPKKVVREGVRSGGNDTHPVLPSPVARS